MIERQGNILEKYRAVATFLPEELNWSYRKIATRCNISKLASSAFASKVLSANRPKKEQFAL